MIQHTKKYHVECNLLSYKGREAEGATYAFDNSGVTLSIVSDMDFKKDNIEYENGLEYVSVKNASCKEDIITHADYVTIRVYEPNPKHGGKEYTRPGGEKVSVMDLDKNSAQKVLNKAVVFKGEVFGVHNEDIYEFRRTTKCIYHGYKRANIDYYEKKAILNEYKKVFRIE